MVNHTSKYAPGQQTNPDTAAITALYVDSIAAYVEAHAPAAPAVRGDGDGRGAGVVSAIIPPQRVTVTAESSPADVNGITLPEPAYIKACTELVRIAIALHLGLLIRLWLVMSELARETNATGFTRKEIKDGLQRYNVKFSGRNLSRWLHLGLADGVFWTYDTRTKRYYHRGYESLVRSIIDECDRAGRENLYLTNYPGQRKPMLVNVASNNLKQFEAFAYSAWVSSRENLIISRLNLFMLWGRTLPALRCWEVLASVEILENFTYCDEQYHDAIPRQANGKWRPDVHRTTLNGRDVIGWQMPNAYSSRTRQHPKKGQLRSVFTRLKIYVKSLQAAGDCERGGDASGGLNRNVRRYHQSNKSARDSFALNGLRPRYVFKGRHGSRYGYFEYTPDGKEQFGYWQVRRLFRRVQCVCFAKRLKKIVTSEDTYTDPF